MKTNETVLKIFEEYSKKVDLEIKDLLINEKKIALYDMMSYFFGFKDEKFNNLEIYAGKRFRSGLCLLLSEMYGVLNQSLEIASAIEIYHNFTLIHDDIEDNDPLRRGRPTLWKLWGISHGINTGDAQLVLANKELIKGVKNNNLDLTILEFLNEKFKEVIEGQFFDFTLTDLPIDSPEVNIENYLNMILHKSSVLIGAATKSAGIIAKIDENEIENLWQYGVNLGFAYQICDDIVSIWGESEMTGKISYNDIREKKKTLPVLFAFNSLEASEKNDFKLLYNKKDNLSDDEIEKVINILDNTGAYEYAWSVLEKHCKKSLDAIEELSISRENKDKLIEINKALLPNVKEVCKC